jgi:hypothetical protein
MAPALRIAIGVVLVMVTAALVWQVAADNRLVPAGPMSFLFGPRQTAARRAVTPPIQRPVTSPANPTKIPAEPQQAAGCGAPAPSKPVPPAAAPALLVTTSRTPPSPAESPATTAPGITRNAAGSSAAANAHYNLALVLEESGEISRAIDHYEQFLSFGGADTATLATDVRNRIQLLRSKLLK